MCDGGGPIRIEIVELAPDNAQDLNACDGTVAIEARLVLRYDGDAISYDVVPAPKRSKRYVVEDVDCTTLFFDRPDRTAFLAYVDGQIAGQIVLRRNWNRFAYVEDLAVDVRFRRRGVGTALLQRAEQWARDGGMPGIMLETQDSNVTACRFYEHFGLSLRGFDTHLYRGITPGSDEIALYWYKVL